MPTAAGTFSFKLLNYINGSTIILLDYLKGFGMSQLGLVRNTGTLSEHAGKR